MAKGIFRKIRAATGVAAQTETLSERLPQPPLPTRGNSQSRSPTTTTTTAPVVMSSQDIVVSLYAVFVGSALAACSRARSTAPSRSSCRFCHFPRASYAAYLYSSDSVG